MDHLRTEWYFGADPCYLVFQFNISVWITLFFSTLFIVRWGQSKLYWNGGSACTFMPCDLNHFCIFSIPTINVSIWCMPCDWSCPCVLTCQQWLHIYTSSCFDDINANHEYLLIQDLLKLLDVVHRTDSALVTIDTGYILAQTTSCGTLSCKHKLQVKASTNLSNYVP